MLDNFDKRRGAGVLCRGVRALEFLIRREAPDITEHVGGYMRFDADCLDKLTELLIHHPTVVHGGTIEVCEMPKT